MGRKKRETIEFRFYEVPQGQCCLALLGEAWIRVYGIDEKYLHFHNLYEIGYCRNGAGDLILDEKLLKYETGMFSLIPANYPHTTISREPNFWEYLFFDLEAVVRMIYPDNPQRQRDAIYIVNKRADLLHGANYMEIEELIKRIMEEMRDKKPYYKETTKSLMCALVMTIVRLHSTMNAERATMSDTHQNSAIMGIKPALEYIDIHFAEDIKALSLAECCSMSETNFRRVFMDNIKMSPMDYLNLVRIQNACRIMQKTEHSMEVVAAECGFANFSTFNRNFKKFLNTSPYQWKKNKDNYANKLLDYNINALKGW